MKKLVFLLSLLQGTPMEPRLEQSDMLNILDEYNVMHTWISPFVINDTTSVMLFGSTNHSSRNIILNEAVGNREERLTTIIHEMLHVKYRMYGIPKAEEEVRMDAQREYRRIFR